MKPKSLPFIAFEHKRFVPSSRSLPPPRGCLAPPSPSLLLSSGFSGRRNSRRPNFGVHVGRYTEDLAPSSSLSLCSVARFPPRVGLDSACFLCRGSRFGRVSVC